MASMKMMTMLGLVCFLAAASSTATATDELSAPPFMRTGAFELPHDRRHEMELHRPGEAQHHPAGHHQVNSHLISVTEKTIDGTVLDIQWLGAQHQHEVVFMLTNTMKLYRSGDAGKTWVDQMPMISSHRWDHAPAGSHVGFMNIIVSEADPSMVLFEGSDGMHAVTTDAGLSYKPIDYKEILSEFKLHPKHTHLMLASSLSARCHDTDAGGSCYKSLFASMDGGSSWHYLNHYVTQYDWAHSLRRNQAHGYPDDTIFASIMAAKMGHQRFGAWDSEVDFVVTKDLFRTHEVLVKRGNRFLFTDKYLCVAEVAHFGNHVNLKLSSDGGRTFFETGMPYAVAQHSYTILDTSEDTIFLHVNHKGPSSNYGHVYISNSIGTNFSLSLPYNRRDENGKCDFEKLQSMEGVYVANFIDNTEELEHQEAMEINDMGQTEENTFTQREKISPRVRTVITHNKGGRWNYLTPPTVDSHHRPIACTSKECSLHLHGVTDVFGPFYSAPSAVGLLMATGCVGDQLCFAPGEINTYFSRDAGLTWQEVAKGSHIYEIGDHGAIVLMSPDEEPVTHIMYSWNEGASWESHRISETPVLVDNIMVEPTSRSQKFIVYGTREDSGGVRLGVVFHVDFSGLHKPVCEGIAHVGSPTSDFEYWEPSSDANAGHCVLGHTISYVRRKQMNTCYNGLAHEPQHLVKHCQCTDMDYECDFGYKRENDAEGGPCVRVPEIPLPSEKIKPHPCPDGHFYHVTDGYRKIAGDTCVGGVTHAVQNFPCSGLRWHHHVSHTGWFVLSVFLLVGVGLVAVTYCQRKRMKPAELIFLSCGLVVALVTSIYHWIVSKIPGRGGAPSRGGYRAAHSSGMDTFDFGGDEDDGLGFGTEDLLDDDNSNEPELVEPGTIARAVSGSSSLLGNSSSGRHRRGTGSDPKKRT